MKNCWIKFDYLGMWYVWLVVLMLFVVGVVCLLVSSNFCKILCIIVGWMCYILDYVFVIVDCVSVKVVWFDGMKKMLWWWLIDGI